MKRVKFLIKYFLACVACVLLFFACRVGEEPRIAAPPPIAAATDTAVPPAAATHSPSTTSSIPLPSPMPIIGQEEIEEYQLFMNRTVRYEDRYIDRDVDGTPIPFLEEYPPQDIVVQVLYLPNRDGGYRTGLRWELSEDVFFGSLHPAYMYMQWMSLSNVTAARSEDPLNKYEVVAEFPYRFDPDVTYTFENQYFDRWPRLREEIIAYETERYMRIKDPDEDITITLIFCEYTELYAINPGDARVFYFVESPYNNVFFYYLNIDANGFVGAGNNVNPLDFKLDYYRSMEFDRAVIRIAGE